MPVLCNAMMSVASTTRMTRSGMLECIRQDYIRTACAKGVPERSVVYKHALVNALIPVITIIGSQVGALVGGSVVVETIFSIPGMGMYLMSSISSRDFPSIMGVVVVLSVFASAANLLVDIIYSIADPRIKAQFSGSNRNKKRKKDDEQLEVTA